MTVETGFEKAAVRRAVLFRECPLRRLPLYKFRLKNVFLWVVTFYR